MDHFPPSRRAYLEQASFESLVVRVADEAVVTEAWVEPYNSPPPGVPKNAARQIIYRLSVSEQTLDIFFNAPDGLRGRYYQGPDHGFEATRRLIDALTSKLLAYAEQHPPMPRKKAAPMGLECIAASLSRPSAKIWPREWGATYLLIVPPPDEQLVVARWLANEAAGGDNKGMWRRKPIQNELEVKGALLGTDGTEHVPPGKRDRSCQLHRFGFT